MYSEQLSNTVYQFYNQFLLRHDFISDDLTILNDKYSYVKFYNIPEAWIITIDEMVEDILMVGQNPSIKVSQKMGFLDVEFVSSGSKKLIDYSFIIKAAERELYLLDADLHGDLNYEEWWIDEH